MFVGVREYTRACVRDENAWSTLCDECTCEEDDEHDSEEPEKLKDQRRFLALQQKAPHQCPRIDFLAAHLRDV